MSNHRLFAQVAFERALGMAAIISLAQASSTVINSSPRVATVARFTFWFLPTSWKMSCRIASGTC